MVRAFWYYRATTATDAQVTPENQLSGHDTPGICRSSVGEPGEANGCLPGSFFPPPSCSSEKYPAGGPFPDHTYQETVGIPYTSDAAKAARTITLEYRVLTPQIQQTKLRLDAQALNESICMRLRSIGRHDLAEPLQNCRTEETIARCGSCGRFRAFWNRCGRLWCPNCQPRLARIRRESVQWWTREIRQPKHVVLTARNAALITPKTVQAFKAAFAKLRRTSLASDWRGGMWTLETTNEGRGWHLHIHALIDADWIDTAKLSKTWGRLVGQDYAIVKVKDVRAKEYLHEVVKYAVKGTDLARWAPSDAAAYIDAIAGQRTFGVWGSLFKRRAEWSAAIEELQACRGRCECGADAWKYYTPNEWAWYLMLKEGTDPPVGATPPKENTLQLNL